MNTIDTDICIIGGGSGGLSVAAGAAQMGARVVLFEADRMGGDCLNSCLLYTSPSPRDRQKYRMPSSA